MVILIYLIVNWLLVIIVKHIRFGRGEVLKIEGKGADIKAEINFEVGGKKKLLLRFAKLEVIG